MPASDGLVYCTPTGMAGHPGLPVDPALLHPGLWVADIVYRPLDTALL
jgi:shikimate dehydrogenase